MKLSVAIAGKDAPPSAFVVWRGFEESVKKSSEYGFQGVELALASADDVDATLLSRWLDRYNLEVSCISTGQVFASRGVYFTHPDREVRESAIKIFDGLIDLAGDMGNMVNVGRVRGGVAENQTRQEAEKLFIDTVTRICEKAQKRNVTILIEPVNRYEINFVNNLDEGAELIKKTGCENLRLMPDVFHMNIEDDKIGQSLIRNGKYVQYIHLADSNRLAPGQGHLDFNEIFNSLKAIKFNGWSSIEILPVPDPDKAALSASQYILPLIEKYNSCIGEGGSDT